MGCLGQLSFHLAPATKSTWTKNRSYLACSTRRRASLSERRSGASENGCLVWGAVVVSCPYTFRLSVHSAREATCPEPQRGQCLTATWFNLPFHMWGFPCGQYLFSQQFGGYFLNIIAFACFYFQRKHQHTWWGCGEESKGRKQVERNREKVISSVPGCVDTC